MEENDHQYYELNFTGFVDTWDMLFPGTPSLLVEEEENDSLTMNMTLKEEVDKMEQPKICQIPVPHAECEDAKRKCSECPYKDNCDMFWVSELWTKENKLNGKNTLLGPFLPGWTKPDMRAGHIISFTGKYDFCCYNAPKSRDYVVIGDIYVDDAARGSGLSKKIIEYLMDKYDKDVFAKCVRGSSAEAFWQHVGIQVDANEGRGPDMYEHPIGKDGTPKRDLGWYMVKNNNKKAQKEELW